MAQISLKKFVVLHVTAELSYQHVNPMWKVSLYYFTMISVRN